MSETIEIDPYSLAAKFFDEKPDEVIVLPTRNEINFVAWMAHEHFWSTDLNGYMQSAKKLHDTHESYRLREAPDSSEMPVYLSPAKSALVRHGLESYLKHEHPQYPQSVLIAESLAALYPEPYQSRLGKLTVKAASEAVDYGTIDCQDLSVRANRLGINRNVLGEILLDHLADMPMPEARSFSFDSAGTQLHSPMGPVSGTRVFPVSLTKNDTPQVMPASDVSAQTTQNTAVSAVPPPVMTETVTSELQFGSAQDSTDTAPLYDVRALDALLSSAGNAAGADETIVAAEVMQAGSPLGDQDFVVPPGQSEIPPVDTTERMVSDSDDDTERFGIRFSRPETKQRRSRLPWRSS